MNGLFKRVISGTLAGTILLDGFEHEALPPEKADPAKFHVPGEPTPADTSINIIYATNTTAGSTYQFSPDFSPVGDRPV